MQRRGQLNHRTQDDPVDSSTASEDGSDNDADDDDDDYHDDDDQDDEYVLKTDKAAYSDCTLAETRTILQLGTLLNGPQWQLHDPRARRAARVDYRLDKSKKPTKSTAAKKRVGRSTVSSACQPNSIWTLRGCIVNSIVALWSRSSLVDSGIY